MTLSQLDLEDVEALHLGPSFLTADTIGPLLDQCEEALFGLPSQEELSSPSCLLSPVHSHHALLPEAKGLDWVLPWLGASDLLDSKCPQSEDDGLVAMDWVSEKLDLGELDLHSLLDSSDDCPESPEDLLGPSPQSPEDLLGPSPQSPEDLLDPSPHSPKDLLSPSSELGIFSTVSLEEVPEASIKTESVSPAHSPERPSEVDVSERTIKSPESDSDSDSGIDSSPSHSPPHTPQSSRTKPYSRPEHDSKKSPKVKSASGPYKSADKKQKKMEQNKTAATRYRQKKRVEQELRSEECHLLEQKNQELSERAQAISKEIQYLKDLMEEVRRHHQNKSKSAAK